MNKVPWSLVKIHFILLRLFQIIHHLLIPLFKKKQEIKVFCVGFFKTGTLSLSKALSILGYRSIHYLRLSKEPKKGWIEYIKKCKYDAYSDAPIIHQGMFQKLDNTFPNSKFILTIRDKKSFQKSYINFTKGSPWAIKDEQDLIKRMQRYENHNKQIINYFKNRPNDLLVMNIIEGDGWEKLCKFLNKPIPDKSFPHKNISRYKKKNNFNS